jgi:hypothetical protein
MSAPPTEFPFVLKQGYADETGDLHKEGIMRLATEDDEILPLHDARVQQSASYVMIIILSRVITRLGTLPMITPKVIESLSAFDFAQLQEMYDRINEHGRDAIEAECPPSRDP